MNHAKMTEERKRRQKEYIRKGGKANVVMEIKGRKKGR